MSSSPLPSARSTLATTIVSLVLCIGLAIPSTGEAHGLWAHVHVTGWAAENLPAGDLRDFLLGEDEVFNALVYGAAYTDAGYYGLADGIRDEARAFGEHTHWEEFIQDFVEHIVENYPPPWDTLQERKTVAFMMGCASHGMQDEIFDSLFLYQVQENDGGNQDNADPASDGFLVGDGHARFFPERFLPMDDLLQVYETLEREITAETIRTVVSAMEFYISEQVGIPLAEGFATPDELPWTSEHYLDPEIPGSIRSEIIPTSRYLQALWKRLHGEFTEDDVIVFKFPESPRRLRSGDSDSVDSWVTFVTGIGVDSDTGSGIIEDEEGNEVDTNFTFTRWNHRHSRIIRFQPREDLQPGDYYSAILAPGLKLVDGSTTGETHGHQFQVACEDEEVCPPIEEPRVATIDGSYEPEPEEPEEPTEEEPPEEEGNPNAIMAGGSNNCSTTRSPTAAGLGLSLLAALGVFTRRRRSPQD